MKCECKGSPQSKYANASNCVLDWAISSWYLVRIHHGALFGRTLAITQNEQLTQRKSEGPIEYFVCIAWSVVLCECITTLPICFFPLGCRVHNHTKEESMRTLGKPNMQTDKLDA